MEEGVITGDKSSTPTPPKLNGLQLQIGDALRDINAPSPPTAATKDRIFNFAAGPANLPEFFILKAQSEFFNYRRYDMSIMEMSHRSKEFDVVIKKAEFDLHLLLSIPDDGAPYLTHSSLPDPDNPSHHFNLVRALPSPSPRTQQFHQFVSRLGVHLWTTGEAAGGDESKLFKKRAAEHFLNSAKLNPSGNAAFRMLGHYYSQVSVDSQQAAKCY